MICPEGATAGDEFVPHESPGSNMTCREIIDMAMLFESESYHCEMSVADESLCCPAAETATTTPVPPDETTTTSTAASTTAIATTSATTLESTLVENPCVICPDGAAAGDDFVPNGASGNSLTCSELIDGATVHDAGSTMCSFSSIYEVWCCPATTAPTLVEGTSISETTTAIPETDVGTTTSTAAPAVETIALATTTIIPEIDDGTTASTAAPVVETIAPATTTAIPEIDGGTATTTTAPVEDPITSINATASPESIDGASGGASFSGFGGFAIVSVVWAMYAVGFV